MAKKINEGEVGGVIDSFLDHIDEEPNGKTKKKKPSPKQTIKEPVKKKMKKAFEEFKSDVARMNELKKDTDFMDKLYSFGEIVNMYIKIEDKVIERSTPKLWSLILMTLLVKLESDKIIKIK